MSIERLFNHRAVVYGSTVTRDEFGGTIETWVALPAPTGPKGFNCAPHQSWAGAQQDHGPGEQQGATRVWFLHKGFDVKERDVVSVEEGPESPLYLRVESVTLPASLARPGQPVNHQEINVEVWQGSIEDLEEES